MARLAAPAARVATLWFALTVLCSAALLFVVQPLVGRLLLPLLGGAPAVWNTCMVFFQAALLGGYLWAHILATRLPTWAQIAAHLALLAAGLLWLPLALPEGAVTTVPTGSDPSAWLLSTLLSTVGLPFFALSASAPLLQRWFALGDHAGARDPYFLYAASNLGSVVALLAYPLVIERHLGVAGQGQTWGWVYALALLPLVLGCAVLAWRWGRGPVAHAAGASLLAGEVTWSRRLRWIGLSLVPSSLLLGVTTALATDIASLPLLWVVPLTLYLFTWILAFAGRPLLATTTIARAFTIAVVAWLMLYLGEATEPAGALIALHLLTFFLAAWMCHARLADDRPPTASLTGFYLCLSLGGVLGGLFNALLSPLLFNDLTEYPLAMVAAALAMPALVAGRSLRPSRRDLAVAASVGAACALANLTLPLQPGPLHMVLVIGLPALVVYAGVQRPQRFALGIGAILLAAQLHPGVHGAPIYRARSFYAAHRVTQGLAGKMHRIVHGNTLHGRQWVDPQRRCEPLAYYHRTGPVGDVVGALTSTDRLMQVGVVGLGAGAMASYAGPRQRWTFFEIDPVVAAIATNPKLFSYLSHCAVGRVEVVLGDARLRLREAPAAGYDLLAVDAFSSDSIPVHLLTREAFDIYLTRLAPAGLLTFHVSNRYLDLVPQLAAQAAAAGLIWRLRDDRRTTAQLPGVEPSRWLVMARQEAFLGPLLFDKRWQHAEVEAALAWTDDFNDLPGMLLSALSPFGGARP